MPLPRTSEESLLEGGSRVPAADVFAAGVRRQIETPWRQNRLTRCPDNVGDVELHAALLF